MNYSNPILSGFYPDPSVCRAGDDYYLVNSTFAYAPGIPIFHSRDLANWEQIGHALVRESQMCLSGVAVREGIYAPTIRYHEGMFYLVTTNVEGGGNFYVTAEDPSGPWSDPVWVPDAEGFDPTLFFDRGKCFYLAQRHKKDSSYDGDCEIWLQELDLTKQELVGERYALWDGAMKHAIWPEGPHLYRHGEYYYLLIAEGGTSFEHSITIARSHALTGPYESCKNNPILTHRHLGRTYPVQNVGHGDLVEDTEGNWHIFMLATRPVNGQAPLGRETFCADVVWENDWPVVNPGLGRLVYDPDREKVHTAQVYRFLEENNGFSMQCISLRHLPEHYGSVTENGQILLAAEEGGPDLMQDYAYIGMRCTRRDFTMQACVVTDGRTLQIDGCEAGLILYFDEQNHVTFMWDGSGAVVTKTEKGKTEVIAGPLSMKKVGDMRITSEDFALSFAVDGQDMGCRVDASYCCEETTSGFTGCTTGICAIAKKRDRPIVSFSDVSLTE